MFLFGLLAFSGLGTLGELEVLADFRFSSSIFGAKGSAGEEREVEEKEEGV